MRRYLSTIISFAILAFDTYWAYDISGGSIMWAAIVCFGIIAMIFAKVPMCCFGLGAVPIDNVPADEQTLLQSAMDEVLQRVQQKEGKAVKPKLYICDNGTQNAYSVGGRIIVERSLLWLDRGQLKAILAHEMSHFICADSMCTAIIELNIFLISIGMIILNVSIGLFAFLIIAIILSMLFSTWISIYIASLFGKFIKWMGELTIRISLFVHRALASLIYRYMETGADIYSVELGYGYSLMRYLRNNGQINTERQSALQLLLDDHPAPYKRIALIEKKMNEQNSITQF